MNRIFRLAALIPTLALAGGAAAQVPAPRAPAPGMATRQTPEQILGLRPDQLPVWRAYQAAVRPHPAKAQPPAPQVFARMTTPQRLDLETRIMAERQADFQARADATRRFYGALTPAQQRTFDELSRLQAERILAAAPRAGGGYPPARPK